MLPFCDSLVRLDPIRAALLLRPRAHLRLPPHVRFGRANGSASPAVRRRSRRASPTVSTLHYPTPGVASAHAKTRVRVARLAEPLAGPHVRSFGSPSTERWHRAGRALFLGRAPHLPRFGRVAQRSDRAISRSGAASAGHL